MNKEMIKKHGSFFVNSSDNPRGYYYEAFFCGIFLGCFDFKSDADDAVYSEYIKTEKSDADDAVYSEYIKTEIKNGRW